MRGQVPENVKGARLTVLQAKLQEYQLLFNQACLGKELEVLIEGKGSKVGEFVGHSPYMQTVIVPSEEDIVGRIVKVKITRSALNNLVGEAI
jgi:tRNA-2-methylthio-N6-dimethylallyladenosine synthase